MARPAILAFAFAGLYGVLIAVGRSSIPGGYYNVFRPAAGFLLAVLLVAPIRHWPALVAIATAVDAAMARRYPGLLPIAEVLPLVNSLSVVLNAVLMRRILRQRRNLLDLRELAFFLAATALGSVAFAAIAGAIFEAFQPGLPVGAFSPLQRWQVWTTANLIGVIVVTPVAMTLLRQPGYRSPLDPTHTVGRWTELLLLLAAVAGLAIVIFRDDVVAAFSMREITYILVPLFTWLVLRFDPRVSLSAWMGVAMLSAWSTQHGEGPFARSGATAHEQVLAVQVFLLVPTLSLLALGGVLNDRSVKEEELAR
ncbi:MAG: MASE1 domain-containing protein, partial [Thermoleophilia bacterium]|nr:MASE1 domain-containing protein [Thermoleophilia bacterium]